ncbi:ABC transporter permease [Polymorphobacter fuscus]|uniref:ABC transporter permease subunit n=1 Tax=Sandarakinorhabdus fusca TaxID=1439888 RepID=A0A7C9GMS2_9SPHN|nr:ABC transporter permease [Polymorphobacter fuscus]KAB7648660.1 ABC transporter permease [Polymorphobacter fuscus]MQT16217.1 ABC transporter permease subunit [Polymorphobacter fuscus]NJC07498.1 peptide/nickel transport system permease protein [Polymorphobacter fuscus]
MTIWGAFGRRVVQLLATMLVVSFLVHLALQSNIDSVAVKVLGQYSTEAQRHAWLVENHYDDPLLTRYWRWLGGVMQGDWGMSRHYQERIGVLLRPRLAASALLAGLALAITVPLSLALGVAAGVRAGGPADRAISALAIVTTSVPDFAMAAFLVAIFVLGLGWLPGVSTMADGVAWRELVLPVAVLVLASTGYLARATRASMVEVMGQPHIRMARLKGVGPVRIITHHALRNALLTPVTLIMLQIPWLLSGVIITEVFFAYRGFGTLLYQAALNSDVSLIQAGAMVSVVVVVTSQLLGDLLQRALDPRLRTA